MAPAARLEEIVFSIGGRKLSLGPNEYVDPENNSGWCHFNADVIVDGSIVALPRTALRNKCVLFDFANKQVGITARTA